jgi:hypothetical protein
MFPSALMHQQANHKSKLKISQIVHLTSDCTTMRFPDFGPLTSNFRTYQVL